MKKLISLIALTVLLAGCSTVFTGIVTITNVVDDAMTTWASMSKAGQTTPAVDQQVIKAHDYYRQACATTQAALITYKATGDQTAYIQALQTAKTAAQGVIDLIVPLVTPTKATTLKNNLAKAHTL